MRSKEDLLRFILKLEGPFSDDPNDPGGVTICGISERHHPGIIQALAAMAAKAGEPLDLFAEKVWKRISFGTRGGEENPAVEDGARLVRRFYETQYFSALPFPWKGNEADAAVFIDGTINMGLRATVKCFQRALNDAGSILRVDGLWGPKTSRAFAEQKPIYDLALLRRAEYYARLPQASRYLGGWINRLALLCKAIRESQKGGRK